MTSDSTPLSEDMLSAHLDGELSDTDRDRVERAVTADPALAAVLDDVRVAREAVRALPPRDIPPGTWDEILDAVNSSTVVSKPVGDDTPGGPTHLGDRRRPRVARWVAVGAAAAAALALFVVPGRDSPDGTPPIDEITDNAAVARTGASDPVTGLGPVGVQAGLAP